MITCCFGQQGSGKTLYLVRRGIIAYTQGRTIYSNFKLKFPHKILYFKDILDSKPQNATVLIDEASLWGLNARSRAMINC